MLKRLHLQNFTVFADAEFDFGPGLNVLVGANGTGKTHVLKAGYTTSNSLHKIIGKNKFDLEDTNKYVREKLIDVFQTNGSEAELVRRGAKSEEGFVEIKSIYPHGEFIFSNIFSYKKSYSTYMPPKVGNYNINYDDTIFIPAKEVLTMSWILAFYDYRRVAIDETYPDLLRLLAVPDLKLPATNVLPIFGRLDKLIGGTVEESTGHFYLTSPDQPRLEMNLVAEGMRKFATLYKLLANGTLTPETTLFWDEPEANLNPALLKEMAIVLTELAQAGFQVILATHSLFLMRELHILAQQNKKSVRYFGLYTSEEGDVRVETTDDLIQLQHLVALDAELQQTFDFEKTLDDEYAGN